MEPVKFTFDKSFDAGAGHRHEEEMDNLRHQAEQEKQAAHQAGFEAGHAQAMGEIESATVAILEQIQQAAAGLFHEFHQVQTQTSLESAQIAHMVGLQLAESLLGHNPTAEIEKILTTVFDEIRDQARLVIRVNPDVAAAIEGRIQQLKESQAFDGELILAADPSFDPQNITVEWADGGIKRDFEEIQQTIQTCVTRYVSSLVDENSVPDQEMTADQL